MKVRMQRMAAWGSFALMAAMVSAASAQQAGRDPTSGAPGTPGAPGRAAQTGRAGSMDQEILGCMIIDNHKEIAMARLGQEHVKHEKVKEFARQMQEEHSQFVRRLEGMAQGGAGQSGTGARPIDINAGRINVRVGDGTSGQAGTLDQPGQTAQTRPGQAEAQAGNATERQGQSAQGQSGQGRDTATRVTAFKPTLPAGLANNPMLKIKQEIAEECINMAQQGASKKNAEEFDMYFVGAQLIAHKDMLASLRVFERHASPQLNELVRTAQQTTEKHIEHAEKLVKELGEQKSSGSGSREERKSSSKSDS